MLSLLSLFVLAFSPTAQAQGGYPGSGGSGGYPGGGGSGGGYPGTTGAGHYDVAYSISSASGNTATYTTSGYPGSGASVSGTDSKSCYTSSGGSPTTYHAAAKNALTATFTWNNEGNPANLAPPAAIITQSSSASWSGQAQGVTPTGDCDPGLPNPNYTSGYLSKSGTATLYTGKSGSGSSGLSSITLDPVTPTASSDATSGSSGGSGANGTINVSYTAAIAPVPINLQGTTKDSSGNLYILVGQGCTASLVGVSPSNTTYSWTVSGTTFQDWGLSSPMRPNASYFIGGYGPSTNSTANWYWNDANQAQETVSCTATVTPPAGHGSPFTLAGTQKVTVQVPQWQASGVGGRMQVNANAPNENGAICLYAGSSPGVVAGMTWIADSYPPQSSSFGMGTLELVQLITPSASYVNTTGVGVPGTMHPDPQKGQGLDGSGFYGWNTVQTGFSGGFTSYTTNDSPTLPLTSYMASATMQHQFIDYLMYQPPDNGNGVRFVPLSTFTWSTNGSATNPGNWANYAAAYGSDAAGTVNPATTTLFIPGNTFPSWTQVFGPAALPWPSS